MFFPFRAVKFTSKLFGRALSRRIKATVLYATETGKSEMYAKKLGEIFGHAFNSQVGWEEHIHPSYLISSAAFWAEDQHISYYEYNIPLFV